MSTITLNGKPTQLQAEPDTPLLWLLRGELKLTGTKYGCGMALCGACTVHVDGQPVRGCVTTLASAEGKAVTTIEGLSGPEARAVKAAWVKLDVVQCGYCQSGQIMTAVALLAKNRQPTNAEIDAAMSGNLCRCGTYPRIREAIHEAARALSA